MGGCIFLHLVCGHCNGWDLFLFSSLFLLNFLVYS
jgi:hypothetical protein